MTQPTQAQVGERDLQTFNKVLEKTLAENNDQLRAALMRAQTILSNMAQENEGAIFNRWPINHEPLRADAKGVLPQIKAALAAAQVGELTAPELKAEDWVTSGPYQHTTHTVQPIQAQIEAAELAKWIKQLKWKSVDKDNMEFEVRTTCYVKDALDKWAALTAAAQVGEDRAAQKIIEPIIKDAITTAVNLTIERCAQMADECAQIHSNPDLSGIAKSIAAAIRRLKDAP